MQQSYQKNVQVNHTDADICRRLRPSALLRYVEQVSVEHAAAMGMDDDFFASRSLAMLLGKQALRFARVPICGESLTLTTRIEMCKRASFKRYTQITDAAGLEVAAVDARWILVDTQRGRILREPTWDTNGYWLDEIPEELPQAVHRCADGEQQSTGARRADYSICDVNGHINNSCYLDIACDALPPELLRASAVIFAAIKYSREVPLGESMEIFRAESGGGWYICGRREGKNAFECYMVLG